MSRERRTQPGESFQGVLLSLRGRAGISQLELAGRLGVHRRSIQGWESGSNYPSASSLQALIAVYLAAGVFRDGREASEAAAIWHAALRQAPRMRTPFDAEWIAGLITKHSARSPAEKGVLVGG